MEHFFHKYVYWLRHHVNKLKKSISHHEIFHSKNARLVVIFIIAAAIPLTVLGVQQIQDIRQNAAGEVCITETTPSACVGEVKVDNLCAEKGTKIKFTKEDGTAFNMERYGFGNGAKNCVPEGNSMVCDAAGSTSSTKPVSHHTVTRDGKDVCKYSIQRKLEPTKNPNKKLTPSPTKKPRDPSRTPNDPKCEGNLTASACTADNKPRLSATWNMDGDDDCTVEVGGKKISTKCSSENTTITADLKSDTSYDLKITNAKGTCKKTADTETTAKCSGGGTKAPTQRPGTTTGPTQKADSTNLEKPKLENHKCDYKVANNTKVTLSWSGNNNISGITYKVEYSPNGKTTETTKKEETLENITKGTKYKYSVTATKTGATSQKTESSFDCPAPTPTKVPGTPIPTKRPDVPGADDIGNPNCPGGVCP